LLRKLVFEVEEKVPLIDLHLYFVQQVLENNFQKKIDEIGSITEKYHPCISLKCQLGIGH
jgi:hypothetical protein